MNIFIGSNGIPIEQSDDGAFHVTQDKSDDSEKFEEIVNGKHAGRDSNSESD